MDNTVSIDIGSNCAHVTIGRLQVWFSYRTPIAFQLGGHRFVRENAWGPTTGKHLNAIDGGNKVDRLPGVAFERELDRVLNCLSNPVLFPTKD